MNRLLDKLLDDSGLNRVHLDQAMDEATALYGGIPTEMSYRIRVCVALSYRKNGILCDLGSYINIYPLVLRLLGMEVTTVDYYPQASTDSSYFNSNIRKVLNIWRSFGICVFECDLYKHEMPIEAYDVVTSFETFEHLLHSPKPLLMKIYKALKSGGEFVVSVPNIVVWTNRLKVLFGVSPMDRYEIFYENGNPYTGHRREMTISELKFMMNSVGMSKKKLFTANLTPPLGANATRWGKVATIMSNSLPMPEGFRSTIYGIFEK